MTKQKVLEMDRNMLILGLYFTTFIRFTNFFCVSLITNHFYCSDEGKKCRKKLFNSNFVAIVNLPSANGSKVVKFWMDIR